jgi:hypothetical protein
MRERPGLAIDELEAHALPPQRAGGTQREVDGDLRPRDDFLARQRHVRQDAAGHLDEQMDRARRHVTVPVFSSVTRTPQVSPAASCEGIE